LAKKPEIISYAEKNDEYYYNSISEAMVYLIDNGVRIINMSLELDSKRINNEKIKQKLANAFEYAKKNDVIVILSAGNSSEKKEDYPGDSNFVVVCGAITDDNKRWDEIREVKGIKVRNGSDYGSRLSVMVPSENMFVCIPSDRRFYKTKNGPTGSLNEKYIGMYKVLPNGGTSSVAPVVSSLAALLLSINPKLKAKETIDLIHKGCVKISDNKEEYGYGRINFLNSIKLLLNKG